MKNPIAVIALLCALVFTAPCPSDAQTINNLGAGRGSVSGTDLFPSYQGALPAVRPSAAQIAAYVYGLMSGDCTASGTGAASCTPQFSSLIGRATLAQLPQLTANSIWINPTGSTANAQAVAVPACANDGAHGLVYVNGTGLVCASITTGATFANPTATAGPTAIPGSAATAMRSDGAPAIQQASNSQKGLVQCDGTTILCPSGVASAQPGVTSRTVTTTTDTILSTDRGNVVYYNSASAVAISQPAPSGSFAAGFFTTLCNINAGLGTITPGSGTIGGASTFPLLTGTAASPKCITYQSDGTNFNAVSPNATVTVAQGTAALGTSAIASGACATVVTVSAPGVATTDVMQFGYNGDPTAVTGYGASAFGAVLSVYPYPSANNVNVKVCNSSSGSITPGSLTLNWKVTR